MNESFPNMQLNLDGYGKHVRSDRDENGRYLIEFARSGIIYKGNFELRFSECVCSELTILKDKRLCFSIYRPPDSINLSIFFEEISVPS